MPLGERKGHTTVRNAQLALARERAVLDDQEQHVVLDLSNALADVERSYQVAQTAYNRRMAARAEVAATKAAFDADKVPLDLYLEAQRRLADAESRFFAALVEYALSVKNVHYEKGTLLDYDEVYLAEGPWPDKAYADAAKRRPARWNPIDYRMKTGPLSAGPVEQNLGPHQELPAPSPPQGQGVNPPPPSGPQGGTAPPAALPPTTNPGAASPMPPPVPMPPTNGPDLPNSSLQQPTSPRAATPARDEPQVQPGAELRTDSHCQCAE